MTDTSVYAVPVKHLACPKGVKHKCEITGQPASVKCSAVPLYFVDEALMISWWDGVGHAIVGTLLKLDKISVLNGSKSDKKEAKTEYVELQTSIFDQSIHMAKNNLVQQNFELAVPGALQALKLGKVLYVSESSEIITTYLLLAEANLGLSKLHVAEEFLSMASWGILKSEKSTETRNGLMSDLHRNFGRLYALQERFKESIEAFATDVFYSTVEYGPNSFKTASSFFHLARIHLIMDSTQNATQLNLKIIGIYLESFGPSRECLATHVELEEARGIAKFILEFITKKKKENPRFCEGFLEDTQQALKFIGQQVAKL